MYSNYKFLDQNTVLHNVNRKRWTIAALVVLVLVIVVVVVLAVTLTQSDKNNDGNARKSSAAIKFNKAAVAADHKKCSQIGNDVLRKNGNAIDALIATLFCNGLLHMHSSGVGGGGFINFYNRTEKKSYIYDYREIAPANASENMFQNISSAFSGSAIGVPGQVKGLHHVWKKHGSLKWADLIQPTIDLAENGFIISAALSKYIDSTKLGKNPGLRALLMKSDNTWSTEGDTLTNTLLASTFKKLQVNPEDFYTGSIAKEIVQDVKEQGGIITEKDLADYTVKEYQPIETKLNNLNFFYMPPPGSGSVIAMVMNILNGFNFTLADLANDEAILSSTHKIIESYKFAFAIRPYLGDPSFVTDISRVLNAMTNESFAESLRRKILPSAVYYNQTFYGGYYAQPPDLFGTTHVSIVAENGDAVAATETINYGFGVRVRSTRNGIIYNNQMDDFSTPGKPNLWGYIPAEANYIKPGKRPLSSMSPTIVTDASGDVVMVAGASGGSRIITATAITLIKKLLFGVELGDAISQPRVHTHLLPYEVYVNKNVPISTNLQEGLKGYGHKLKISPYGAVVQAIYRKNAGDYLYAKCDPRKGGEPAGY